MYPINFNIDISVRMWNATLFYKYVKNGVNIPTVAVNTIYSAIRRVIRSEFKLKKQHTD